MFGSILVLASSVARAASKYHLLLRDPHFSVICDFRIVGWRSRRNDKRHASLSWKHPPNTNSRFRSTFLIRTVGRSVLLTTDEPHVFHRNDRDETRNRLRPSVVTPSEQTTFEESCRGVSASFRELEIRYRIDTSGSYILTARTSKPCNRLGPTVSSFKNSSIYTAKILDWISWDEAAVTRLASSIPKTTDRKSSAARRDRVARNTCHPEKVSSLPYTYTRVHIYIYVYITRLVLASTKNRKKKRERERNRWKQNIVDGCFSIAFRRSTLRRWSTAVKRRKEERNERDKRSTESGERD